MATPAAKKVKLEHEGTPAPSSTPTPAPYTTTAQWSTGQIPIDPALQQQPPAVPQHMMYPHFQTYAQASHHYASPYSHYQQYQPPQQQQPVSTPAPAPAQTAAPAPVPAPIVAASSTPVSRQPTQVQHQQPASNNNAETNDIATLNDALGSAGVDLRAEEEHLSRSQDHHTSYRSYEDRSRRQPSTPNFDSRNLQTKMTAIGKQHKVNRIPDEAVQYIALALRSRLQTLVTGMVEAATHRAESQFDRTPTMYEDKTTPMWSIVVRKDTRKILDVLERVEREEEMKVRRERKQREEHAAMLAAQALAAANAAATNGAGDGEGVNGEDIVMAPAEGAAPKKAKKKKDGPGVTARNMSEDVQKRLSNAVATQAAGLSKGKYAWMNAGAVSSPAGKVKKETPAASASTPTTNGIADSSSSPTTANAASQPTATATTTSANASSSSSWTKPYVSTSLRNVEPAPGTAIEEDKGILLTMRDAMFVIDRERGHGGGRGAAKGWV